MSDKTFVGKGRKVGQYGNVAFSVCIDDVESSIFEYNGKRYVKLMVGEMRQADSFGKTHNVWLDDFKPDPSKRREAPQTSQKAPQEVEYPADDQINPEDIPF
jgi:hypothetical protein